MEKSLIKRSGVGFRFMTAAALIAGAVLLPQIVHLLGRWSGTGSALGTIILPMHFAVLLSGLILGPIAGGMIGVSAPIVSYCLTGMPAVSQLFLMCVELAVYGIAGGVLARKKIPTILTLFSAQLSGRIVKLIVAFLIGMLLPESTMSVAAVASSFVTGLPGMIMQLCLIPALFYRFKGLKEYYV